jgi:hypothetical protein
VRAVLSLGAAGALAVSLAGCGNSDQGATLASRPASTPACASSALAVWLGLGEGGGTAGSTYYPLELTNVTGSACHLLGFPGVSAWSGHQLGSPAQRDHSHPAQTVTLAAGDTAHALLRITDVGNLPAASCGPTTAAELKVFPPNERSARFVPFTFRACSKAGPAFLSVQAVQPGVGVPGYPSL